MISDGIYPTPNRLSPRAMHHLTSRCPDAVHAELVPPPPRNLPRGEEDEESVASSQGDTSLASLGKRVVTVTGEGEADGIDGASTVF